MNILVFQTAFLGDLLLAVPLLKNVRKLYPQSRLHLVCRKGFGHFFLDMGLVDEVLELDKKNKLNTKEVLSRLNAINLDLVLCPHESFRSAWLLSKVKAKTKVSFRRWFSGFFFDVRVPRPFDLPDAMRQMSLLVPLDSDFGKQWLKTMAKIRSYKFQNMKKLGEHFQVPSWAEMKLEPSLVKLPESVLEGRDYSKKLLAMAPGSVWNTKRWPSSKYIELGKKLREQYQVVILGAKSEAQICQELESSLDNPINLCGKTSLTELYQVLKEADLLVCNDSGTMHMAAVAGTPNLSVFGPTTLDLGYRPWQNQALVAEIDLKCRPCGKHGHDKCPIGTHQCMEDLSANYVQEMMEQISNR